MLKASVIGNLGNDPEFKYSRDGAPFLRFSVACNSRMRTPEGEWGDRTEWVKVTVFGQRAEALGQHLRKGQRVFVDGRLEAHPWTDQLGNVRAGLELVADTVEFMSGRQEDDATGQQPAQTAVRGAQRRTGGTAVADRDDGGDLDDLPF